MSNPLFGLLGGRSAGPNIWGQFQQFARTVKGNPQQLVQQLMDSGRMSPEQFRQYSQIANSIVGKK